MLKNVYFRRLDEDCEASTVSAKGRADTKTRLAFGDAKAGRKHLSKVTCEVRIGRPSSFSGHRTEKP